MTDSFSDKQIKQLTTIIKNVVNEVIEPIIKPIIDKLDKLDDKVNKLDDKVNKIETKLEKLEKSFNGYISKESEIYELKSNDIFSRFLNENNKMYKELSLRLFYSSTKLITDFDGLFLVNYLQHIKPLKTIYNNDGKPKNVVNDFPNKQIVIIEAKHDLDKSKIDKKLIQLLEIQEVLKQGIVTTNVTRSRGAGRDYQEMLNNPEFQILVKQYTDIGKSNIYLLFAAENITKSLETYIQAIYEGSLDRETYIKLTNQILASHDKKLIDTIIKSGANTIKTTTNNELKTYINNFVPEYDYINQYNFSPKNEYHNLMMVLKSYAIPYESLDWSLFVGKIGIIMNNEVKFYGE